MTPRGAGAAGVLVGSDGIQADPHPVRARGEHGTRVTVPSKEPGPRNAIQARGLRIDTVQRCHHYLHHTREKNLVAPNCRCPSQMRDFANAAIFFAFSKERVSSCSGTGNFARGQVAGAFDVRWFSAAMRTPPPEQFTSDCIFDAARHETLTAMARNARMSVSMVTQLSRL